MLPWLIEVRHIGGFVRPPIRVNHEQSQLSNRRTKAPNKGTLHAMHWPPKLWGRCNRLRSHCAGCCMLQYALWRYSRLLGRWLVNGLFGCPSLQTSSSPSENPWLRCVAKPSVCEAEPRIPLGLAELRSSFIPSESRFSDSLVVSACSYCSGSNLVLASSASTGSEQIIKRPSLCEACRAINSCKKERTLH